MQGDHHHIVAFVCPSMSALCHEPWSQMFLIPSSPPSMLSLNTGSSSTSFSSTSELSLYWIIDPLQSAWNYLSNEWSFIPIGLRTRELRPCYFVGASCPRLISECVTPKVLVVTSCTGLLQCWFLMHWKVDLMEHLNIQFLLFYISEHVLNLDENSSAPFRILEVLMILILAFITNSWEWFTMPTK
jgi:hypothetical protein